MAKRQISLNAIKGALASSKTPAHLKAGLLKKYGHLLQGVKHSMSTLATTVHANPKKRKNPAYGYGAHDNDDMEVTMYNNPPKRKSRYGAMTQGADVYVTKEGKKWILDYPAGKYTGAFATTLKGTAQLKAFLKPAIERGLIIEWAR